MPFSNEKGEGLENRIKSDTALLGGVIKAQHIRVD